MSLSNRVRFEVFRRDGFACQYCGRKAPVVKLEVDHIDAKAHGGDDDPANLITACYECNRGKGVEGVIPFRQPVECIIDGPGCHNEKGSDDKEWICKNCSGDLSEYVTTTVIRKLVVKNLVLLIEALFEDGQIDDAVFDELYECAKGRVQNNSKFNKTAKLASTSQE